MTNSPSPFGSLLPVVAVALVRGDGRILVQQRPPGGSMAGLWEFPGGKVEPDETPEDALIRECAEELGIGLDRADLDPLIFASETLGARHLLLLLYVATRWSGTPTAHHASALQWATPDELTRLAMPPADAPFITALRTRV